MQKKVNEISKGKGKVAILGITYREGVKELAYTRAIPLIELLKKKGYEVFVNDPLYTEKEIKDLGYQYLSTDTFQKMDALVLMNKDEYYNENLNEIKDKVIDIKNVLKD